jgi:hypothetical protein
MCPKFDEGKLLTGDRSSMKKFLSVLSKMTTGQRMARYAKNCKNNSEKH